MTRIINLKALVLFVLVMTLVSCVPGQNTKKNKKSKKDLLDNIDDSFDSNPQELSAVEYVESCSNLQDIYSCPQNNINHKNAVLGIKNDIQAIDRDFSLNVVDGKINTMALNAYKGRYDNSYAMRNVRNELFVVLSTRLNSMFINIVGRPPSIEEFNKVQNMFIEAGSNKNEVTNYIKSLKESDVDVPQIDPRCKFSTYPCNVTDGNGAMNVHCENGKFLSYGECIVSSCNNNLIIINNICVINPVDSDRDLRLNEARTLINNFRTAWELALSNDQIATYANDIADGKKTMITFKSDISKSNQMINIISMMFTASIGRVPNSEELARVQNDIVSGKSRAQVYIYI